MLIPIKIRYDLGSVTTLYCYQKVHLKRYDYPIQLIFKILIPITTRYNVISKASL